MIKSLVAAACGGVLGVVLCVAALIWWKRNASTSASSSTSSDPALSKRIAELRSEADTPHELTLSDAERARTEARIKALEESLRKRGT